MKSIILIILTISCIALELTRPSFNITEDEYKKYLHHLEKNGLN